MEGRQAQQSNENNLHIMLMFHEASTCLWINSGKPSIIIKCLVSIRACGAIEPCLL